VDESAVMTVLAFSSALAADARLTTPRAASAIVHLLNFISSSDSFVLSFFGLVASKERGQIRFALAPKPVHLGALIGKTFWFDNKYFPESGQGLY
jgi:hypothetical protein